MCLVGANGRPVWVLLSYTGKTKTYKDQLPKRFFSSYSMWKFSVSIWDAKQPQENKVNISGIHVVCAFITFLTEFTLKENIYPNQLLTYFIFILIRGTPFLTVLKFGCSCVEDREWALFLWARFIIFLFSLNGIDTFWAFPGAMQARFYSWQGFLIRVI